MTAEVLIMNKTAVALAADSAVTITHATGEKIYYSINKLFMLSKYYPVGAMTYGSAEFMSVPWETIIKAYRKRLGRTKFDTLEEYARGFLDFLREKDGPLFPESAQEEYLDRTVSKCFRTIGARIQSTITEEGEIGDERKADIVSEEIKWYHEFLEEGERVPSASEDRMQEIIEKYGDIVTTAGEAELDVQLISEESLCLLREICKLMLSRGKFYPEFASGIVIAGFGEQEVFPSFYSYYLEGLIDGYLKHVPHNSFQIDSRDDVFMSSFAQTEMVHTFMDGIDPAYKETIRAYLTELLEEYPQTVLDALPQLTESDRTSLLEELTEVGEKLRDDFFANILHYERVYHSNPVLLNVSYLPKDELATMAESLVNITSFKRRVSVEAETVGGPIDVAVISKGDGFVWVKRKRYFEPEDNPHLLANCCCE